MTSTCHSQPVEIIELQIYNKDSNMESEKFEKNLSFYKTNTMNKITFIGTFTIPKSAKLDIDKSKNNAQPNTQWVEMDVKAASKNGRESGPKRSQPPPSPAL